jgi:hypothetical protein
MRLRRLSLLLAAAVLPLVLAAPAAAHHLIVTPPGKDEPVHAPFEHWVGGPTPLPAQAQGAGLFFSFGFGGNIPAAHGAGLVQACLATRANGNGVVAFAPPPFGTADLDCRHGPP